MPGTIPAARQHLIDDIAKLARKTARRSAAAAGVRAGLLPRRRRGGPAAARCGSVRGIGRGTPRVRHGASRRRAHGPRIQPGAGARRLGIAAHDRRGRHRRHAVPRRLAGRRARRLPPADPADDPPGAAHGARPSRQAAAHGGARRRARHDGIVAARGRAAHRRSGAARGAARRTSCARWKTCASPSSDWPAIRKRALDIAREVNARRAGHPAPRREGSRRVPRLARRQPLHFPRLPRIPARARPRDGPAGAGPAIRPRPAAHRRGPPASRSRRC